MNEPSQKQIAANRENGKKGGVKTEEGKEVSKYNALKHGLLSKEVLLDGEEVAILNDFGRRIRESLAPVGPLEEILVDRIISGYWRLRRAIEVEKNTMEWSREAEMTSMHFNESDEQIRKKSVREMIDNDTIEKILRYETAIERSIFKAIHELERLQAKRGGEKVPLPIAIDVDISGEKPNGFVS